MTNSYKYGNGRLILGTGPLNVTAQLTACQVTPSESVSTIDAIPVLSGGEIAKEESAEFAFVLSGKLLQDLAAAGVVDWSWTNAGTEQPFVFVPDLASERGVEGVCYPVPLTIGGEVTKPRNRPQSDFTWRCKGTPVFGVYDGVEDDVTEDV